MKTYVHIWYLAQFFIPRRMSSVSDKIVQKIKAHNFVFHSVLFIIVQLYLFTSGFKTKILYASFLYPALTICPAHDIFFPTIYKFPVINLVCSLLFLISILCLLIDFWHTGWICLFFPHLHIAVPLYRLTSRLFISTDMQEILLLSTQSLWTEVVWVDRL